jgi:non-specific serine/threonine protein kinase
MAGGVLDGLQHLHENGLIHRDLKPGNVMVQRGRPRLTDFGLTRVLNKGGHTTNLAGTPGYMAPEAFQGKYSPASDVWAVGILMHELLTGALPYPQADFYALLLAITDQEPVPLSLELPEALRPLLAKALAKPVADRFASAREVKEAIAAAMASPPAPAVATSKGGHNLPAQTTTFIGRQTEIAEIKSLLGRTRLLTLTGSGGCGKTRLSLQMAAEVLEPYADGIWLVELAPLADPSLVAQALAQVLGVSEEPGRPLLQTLAQRLKYRKTLLILDNCEHLLDACSRLVETLLHACPDIKVLASSRESLNIAGELAYRVPSLSLPDSAQLATAQSISRHEAVRLFAERAQFYHPSFTLTDANAASVASICRRLDGIPLAIELAAARVRSMTVEELGQRLDNRFRLLTGGSRTALPRQQTLRALIDWSYDLLDESQKAVLCRVSVFAGGWTLEAAEAVCADGVWLRLEGGELRGESTDGDKSTINHQPSTIHLELTSDEIFDLLTTLCDKSLVVAEPERGHTRYRLLETVRQYARDRLVERGEAEAVRRSHLGCFLALAEEAEPQLLGANQAVWLDRLAAEHDNLRAALEHSLGERGPGEALRLCGALRRYWWTRGHLSEGREWCERALSEPGAQKRTMERATALNAAGTLADAQGDFAAARAHHEAALSIRREIGDRAGMARSLNNLGSVAGSLGDYVSARSYFEDCLPIFREIGDRMGLANSLNHLGLIAHFRGDSASARTYYEESLAICQVIEDRMGVARSLGNLGGVAGSLGDYVSARTYFADCLDLCREIGDRSGVAAALDNFGSVAQLQADYPAARAYHEESLSIRREVGDRRGMVGSLNNLGNTARSQGDCSSARSFLQESLVISCEIGDRRGAAGALTAFACLNAAEGALELAGLFWGAAEQLREELGIRVPVEEREEYDRSVSAARRTLGDDTFAAAWATGRALTMDQAVDAALKSGAG